MNARNTHTHLVLAWLVLAAWFLGSLHADQTWTGAAGDQWTNPTNWSGNALPGPGDAVVYNQSSSGSLSNWLAQDFSIRALILSNVPAPVSISSDSNVLTLSGGINLSNPAQGLTLAAPLSLTATQTWGVAVGQTLLVSGAIGGSGGIYKDGPGALYLSGSNTFTGNVTNNGGPIWIDNSSALGAGPKTIYICNNSLGAGLHLNGTNGGLSLPGNFTFLISQNQGVIFNEAGDNVIKGNLYVYSGGGIAYILANAGSLTLNGTIGLATSPRAIMLGGVALGTNNGGLTAGLPLRKADSGSWTLNANNTYTGVTTVEGGTLFLGPQATLINTPSITVFSNATLDVSAVTNNPFTTNTFYLSGGSVLQTLAGSGTVIGNIGALSTAYLVPGGSNAVGTLTFSNNLALNPGVTASFDLNTDTTAGSGSNDLVSVAGDLDAQYATLFVTAQSPLTGGGNYTLVTYGGAELSPFSSVQTDTRYSFTLNDLGGGQVTVTASGSNSNLVWSGGGGASWDTFGSYNWDGDTQSFYNADAVAFDDTSPNNLVTLVGAVRPASVVVSNNAVDYTFAGSGKITGLTGLTKAGAGTLALSAGGNDFTGPVAVSGGTLSVSTVANSGTASPLGAGNTIVLDGGTFRFTGARPAAGSFNRFWSLGPNGGTVLSTNGTFFIANQISGPGSLTKTGAVQVILGDITAGIIQPGASNSYAGDTYINQGELQIRNPQALGLGKAVVAYGADLAFGGGANFGTFTNAIDLNGGDGNGGAGTLQVNDANSQANFAGPITLVADSSVGSFTGSTRFIISGAISGPGALKKTAHAVCTVVLTCPTNSYGGSTWIVGGTLQLGNGDVCGSLGAGPVTNNGTLAYLHSDTVTNSLVISGTGALSQSGSGTLVLSGADTFSGTTTVNGGALVVNGALGTNTVTVGTNATLGGYGVIGGPVLLENGATLALGSEVGTLTISNALTLNGTTWMKVSKSGTVLVNDSIQGPTTVVYGGTLNVTASGDALAAGDSFQLFAAAGSAGAFTATNLPALTPNLFWDTSALTNGTLAVASYPPIPPVVTSFFALPEGNFQLTFSGGNGFPYRVWASTNATLSPVTETWDLLNSGTFGQFPISLTDTQAPNYSQRFYRITTP